MPPQRRKTNTSSTTNKRRSIPPKVREFILKRDNYTCKICGKGWSNALMKDTLSLEIDHKIPVARGGTNDMANLQVLCRKCNNAKRDREFKDKDYRPPLTRWASVGIFLSLVAVMFIIALIVIPH